MLEPYYPIAVILIAVGIYMLIRTIPLLDSDRLLAKNEEYTNQLGFEVKKKARKK